MKWSLCFFWSLPPLPTVKKQAPLQSFLPVLSFFCIDLCLEFSIIRRRRESDGPLSTPGLFLHFISFLLAFSFVSFRFVFYLSFVFCFSLVVLLLYLNLVPKNHSVLLSFMLEMQQNLEWVFGLTSDTNVGVIDLRTDESNDRIAYVSGHTIVLHDTSQHKQVLYLFSLVLYSTHVNILACFFFFLFSPLFTCGVFQWRASKTIFFSP